jgi:hypothetical protein
MKTKYIIIIFIIPTLSIILSLILIIKGETYRYYNHNKIILDKYFAQTAHFPFILRWMNQIMKPYQQYWFPLTRQDLEHRANAK